MDINDDQHNGGLEDQFEDSPDNIGDVSLSAVPNDVKMASSSCSKRSKRIMKKRVVSVPIREIEGFRMKGDHTSAPPSDSWAWRKYGQKPIKGSPYPRGYYRCSSSKACPARKQVERSRVDPDMLMVTYSCEHNHPSPASKNNNQNHNNHRSNTSTSAATTEVNATSSVSVAQKEEEKKAINHFNRSENNSEENFTSLVEVPQIIASHEFAWSNDFESTSCASLESSILRQDKISTDKEMGVAFTMEEEEESLFADLDELPECSTVFRHGLRQSVEEQRQHSLAPWCGSTWISFLKFHLQTIE